MWIHWTNHTCWKAQRKNSDEYVRMHEYELGALVLASQIVQCPLTSTQKTAFGASAAEARRDKAKQHEYTYVVHSCTRLLSRCLVICVLLALENVCERNSRQWQVQCFPGPSTHPIICSKHYVEWKHKVTFSTIVSDNFFFFWKSILIGCKMAQLCSFQYA